MTEHKPYVCTRDYGECSPCSFCDGGLFLCVVCGSAEGGSTTDCPGVRMTDEQQAAVYAGTLDYKNGQWIEP